MPEDIPEDVQEQYLDALEEVLKINMEHHSDFPRTDVMLSHLLISIKSAARSMDEHDGGEGGNDGWLLVAAVALRLYHDSQEQNMDELVEMIEMVGQRAERKLKEHFTNLVNEKKNQDKKTKKLSDYLSYNPYTKDEIEDIKAAERRRQNGN